MSDLQLEHLVTSIPDYPEEGVIFQDMTPLFSDPQAFARAVDAIATEFMPQGVTKVVAAEARGFIVGGPVAYRLNAGFVPARRPGKLPRNVVSQRIGGAAGSSELQVHADSLGEDDRVLIVDDLLATGDTALAVARLVSQTGAAVVGFACITELSYLNPRERLQEEFPQKVLSLVQVD